MQSSEQTMNKNIQRQYFLQQCALIHVYQHERYNRIVETNARLSIQLNMVYTTLTLRSTYNNEHITVCAIVCARNFIFSSIFSANKPESSIK